MGKAKKMYTTSTKVWSAIVSLCVIVVIGAMARGNGAHVLLRREPKKKKCFKRQGQFALHIVLP